MTNLQASQDTARVSQTNRNSTTAAAWTVGQSVVEYCSYIINYIATELVLCMSTWVSITWRASRTITCAQLTVENAKNAYRCAGHMYVVNNHLYTGHCTTAWKHIMTPLVSVPYLNRCLFMSCFCLIVLCVMFSIHFLIVTVCRILCANFLLSYLSPVQTRWLHGLQVPHPAEL